VKTRIGACCALLVAVALPGCATGEGSGAGAGDTLTVYVSGPLRGPSAPYGRAIRDGARLALEDADGRAGEIGIEAVFLDDTGRRAREARWSAGQVAENARAATSDSAAIAYIGEFESGATRVSLPITNEARMLQVSPASAAIDLVSPVPGSDEVPERVQPSGERSFGRVIPDDELQGAAGAVWADRLRSRDALALSLERFGNVVAGEFAEEAEQLGIPVVRARTIVRLMNAVISRVDLVYIGAPAQYGTPLVEDVARDAPSATLISTDALLLDKSFLRGARPFESRLRLTAAAQNPAQLPPPAGPEFVRGYRDEYGRPPDPYAAYGYEAMAVVLDSIERAGEPVDRSAVIDAFFDTVDRRSVLGTYSIDEVGNTTLDRIAGYRVRAGRPVFDAALRAP
jgi:branched-chain amino acid transport system substrate-binding protein